MVDRSRGIVEAADSSAAISPLAGGVHAMRNTTEQLGFNQDVLRAVV
jgi:hypothetical protein